MLLTPIPAFMPQAANANSVAYTNFIARTSGLDATHLSAYAGLLNGLTTDGLFNSDGTSSFLDCLYIWATQDSTTALLNLVSSSHNATLLGAPTFTADQGYSSFVATTKNINSNFNPTTAGGHYSQNSACIGVWCYDAPTTQVRFIAGDTGSGTGENLYPSFSGSAFMRVNDNPETSGFTLTNAAGFFLGNRSSSTGREGYKNTTSIGTYGSSASAALLNANYLFCDAAITSTASAGVLGGSLSSTNETFVYNRLRTYMTAVGVP